MTAFDGKGVDEMRVDLVVELIKSHFESDKFLFINMEQLGYYINLHM